MVEVHWLAAAAEVVVLRCQTEWGSLPNVEELAEKDAQVQY